MTHNKVTQLPQALRLPFRKRREFAPKYALTEILDSARRSVKENDGKLVSAEDRLYFVSRNDRERFDTCVISKKKLNFRDEAKLVVKQLLESSGPTYKFLGRNRQTNQWGIQFISFPYDSHNGSPEARGKFVPSTMFWTPEGTKFEDFMRPVLLGHIQSEYSDTPFVELSNQQRIALIQHHPRIRKFPNINTNREIEEVEYIVSPLEIDTFAGSSLVIPSHE